VTIVLQTNVSEAPAVIELSGIHKMFVVHGKQSIAIADAGLTVHERNFVTIIGPSGCGKSTLLNMIAGLVSADSGRVLFRGRTVSGPNTDVGYLTQDDALLPWRSVLANVVLPLEIRGVPKEERNATAREMIVRVGLKGFERHHPSQLSGGMRKRVSLARTLVWGTNVLLLDEPFGALDAQTKLIMQQLLINLAQRLELTVVLVTHDLDEAIFLSDEIVIMSKRPGRILEKVAVSSPRPRDIAKRTEEEGIQYEHLWASLRAQQEEGE
jgi:NitT/TauT family transport system ATP-binding protein